MYIQYIILRYEQIYDYNGTKINQGGFNGKYSDTVCEEINEIESFEAIYESNVY